MSHIGTGNNFIQPNKQCLSCKYWTQATRGLSFLDMGGTYGYCRAGYCKKNSKRK